ncbi:alpha/beta hydrolase [Flavobacteriaceae bacterium 3-367]
MKNALLILLPLFLLLSRHGLEPEQSGLVPKEVRTEQGIWRYEVSNKGKKAILFLHGAGSSKKIWKKQHSVVLQGYKNIFVDLLGYGASDQPDSGYNLANWIKGIHLVLENEKVDEVCIVAHSNGVIFAKEYYRAYPEKISSLLLLDGMLKQLIKDEMLAWMKSTLERSDYESFMANNIQHMPVKGLSDQDVTLLKTDALNTPKTVTMAEFELVNDPSTWEDLTIACPVTVVHSNNPLWNDAYVEWLQHAAPNHQFYQWNDSGHFIPLEHPERLNSLITEVVPGK